MILSFLRCNDDGPLFLECSSFFLRGFGTSGTNIGKPTLAIKEQHDTGDEEQDEKKECAIQERLDDADTDAEQDEKKECAIKERIDDADTDARTMDTNGTDERQDEEDKEEEDDDDNDYETDDDTTTHQECATALSRFLNITRPRGTEYDDDTMIASCYEDEEADAQTVLLPAIVVPNNDTMHAISSFELGSRNYTTEEEEDYGSEDERNDDEQLDITSTSSTQEEHDVEDEQLDTTCTTTSDVHDRNEATENVACEEEDGNADTDDDAVDDDTNATEATAENKHDENDKKDTNQDPEDAARCSKKDAAE